MAGTLAAIGVRHAPKHWSGIDDFAREASYFSGALIVLVGCLPVIKRHRFQSISMLPTRSKRAPRDLSKRRRVGSRTPGRDTRGPAPGIATRST
ncbi:TPA: hypothetical protein QDA74_004642 [Burkholderia territorii]|uniref:hypothetical protein n=1 Tax=Burkholderia territorii TaxID=1503055 RepID=UPI000AE50F74|nr:hypothetical protein [Burkholderia territorii]TXG03731.1 hypothetical protein FU139_29585 [Burkholderia territorii]HDR8866298.1 hypothetical protein [Burkholderia territorii]HDR8872714.1 hypothetical protein [Burkholderia territorii]HDR8879114.1 hypothetical protein [Burkholderia territorii]HDR8885147.1 hypothetical protein [Burkholderia territorii]